MCIILDMNKEVVHMNEKQRRKFKELPGYRLQKKTDFDF